MECKNCNQSLDIKDKFCSECGQKNISKLNIKFVFGEVFQTIFNIDSKAIRSLRFLIFKPGFLTKEYVEGKRVSYLAPIRIYLVLSFLYFFLITAFNFDNASIEENDEFLFTLNNQEVGLNNNTPLDKKDGIRFSIDGEDVIVPVDQLKRMQYNGTLDKGLDSLTADMPKVEGYVQRKMAMVSLDDRGFMDVLRDQFSMFLILFLPFFALLYGTVFSRSKKGIVGNLIFNLHLNSFVIFIFLVDLFVDSSLTNYDTLNIIWTVFIILYLQYYIIKSIMVFYQRKWWIAIYKYAFLLFGYTVLGIVFLIAIFFFFLVMI